MDSDNDVKCIKYSDPPYNDVILCPYCGDGYLHHKRVVIYHRYGEDSKDGLAVTVTSEGLATNGDISENPSSRRDGLVIHFECENCDNTPILAVSQHKGTTSLHWIR